MHVDDYSYNSCECSKGHEFKSHLRMILEIKKEIAELENRLGLANATNEYLKMIAFKDKYTPPIKSSNRCDFVLIGEKIACTHCHAMFERMDNYIPPFCPFCYAEREAE